MNFLSVRDMFLSNGEVNMMPDKELYLYHLQSRTRNNVSYFKASHSILNRLLRILFCAWDIPITQINATRLTELALKTPLAFQQPRYANRI